MKEGGEVKRDQVWRSQSRDDGGEGGVALPWSWAREEVESSSARKAAAARDTVRFIFSPGGSEARQ